MFDIVIPLGPNEYSRFSLQLKNVLKFVVGFRNIYIVTPAGDMVRQILTEYNDNELVKSIQVIDESIFPFSISDLLKIYPKENRVAWYFQQLLKLYSGSVIPGILEDYLVIDADVFFMKPIYMFGQGTTLRGTKLENPIFDFGSEYHPPYFEHMLRMNPCFKRMSTKNISVIEPHSFRMFSIPAPEYVSGINHHMMFRKSWLDELFLMCTSNGTAPFWQVFMENVKEHLNHSDDVIESGASEYELYFHFVLQFHPKEIMLRKLNWQNVGRTTLVENLSYENTGLDFVSVCHWMH